MGDRHAETVGKYVLFDMWNFSEKEEMRMNKTFSDKLEYISYILAVAEECNLEDVLKDVKYLKSLSLKELDKLSMRYEDLYELHTSNTALDNILAEIDDRGVEFVKDKYNL